MDFQTPFGGRNRMKLSKAEYVKAIFGTVLLFSLIVGYAFELRHFSNTFGVSSMIVRALLFGLVVGLLVGFFYVKRFNDALEKFQVGIAFVFAGLFLAPLLASWVNRGFAFNEVRMEKVELQEQQVFSQSRFGQLEGEMQVDGYYLFFLKNKKLERVKTKQLLFPKETPKGTIVEIPLRDGGLGYEYFSEKK